MEKKIMIIINPIAGSGKGERLLNHLERALAESGFKTVLQRTNRVGDAFNTVRNARDFTAVICIGGDGTVNEMINGLIDYRDTSTPLGILPVGSGNVIAKELDLSCDIKHFVHLLEQGKTRCLDLGYVFFPQTGVRRHFISMAGIGFDAEITRLYQEYRQGKPKLLAHLFSYLPLGLRRVTTYKLPSIRVEVDGKLVSTKASFVQIANVRSYGGPFVFVAQACPDDGWLDVAWFTGYAPRDILRYFWNAFWGNAGRCVDAHHTRGKKVVLSSSDHVPLQVDGDWCGYLPTEIEILPRAISILAPPGFLPRLPAGKAGGK